MHSGLSNPSLFNPPGSLAPSVQVFKNLVLEDLEKLSRNKKRVYIKSEVKKGLEMLCERKNLIIRPADKGVVL